MHYVENDVLTLLNSILHLLSFRFGWILWFRFGWHQQPPKKGKAPKEETAVQLGPQVAEGEIVFGVAHIFASFNDTFVHITDLSGKETISRVTGALLWYFGTDTFH